MTHAIIPPQPTPLEGLEHRLIASGFAVLTQNDVCRWTGCTIDELADLSQSWNDLPLDHYLRDGGRYRRRRHSSYTFRDGVLTQAAHRAHWQPIEYNALHGGMTRWFEPVLPEVSQLPAWDHLLTAFGRTMAAVAPDRSSAMASPTQCIETHQFRIDTSTGIGRPTPEGAHRDGVDLVAVFIVARHQIIGGETRVFAAGERLGERFTLVEPWSVLLLMDDRVIHESTPIQPVDQFGYRDTLVLTGRNGSFLGDQEGDR